MKNLFLFLFLFFNCSFPQKDKLITNSRIGPYKLGKQLNNTYDKNTLDIVVGRDNLIKSIIVRSPDYKTSNGFGVGSSIIDIETLDKKLIKKPLSLSKGNVDIANLGICIKYENISFVDGNDDGIIDYVWIQK